MGISDHSLIYGVTKFVLPKGKQRLYPLIRLTTLGILLKKLQLNGLEPHAVQWFKSYLSDRFQSTYVYGTLSDYLPFICGVLLGSFILGPLLFLFHINDLQVCELSSSVLAYPFLLLLHNSWRKVKDLDEVQKWLKSNKPTLKVKKTKYMIIGRHYRLRHQQLTRVTNHRYLGIEVEQALG